MKVLRNYFAVVALCLIGSTAWGQTELLGQRDGVSVYYNKGKNDITVANNSGSSILLFKSGSKKYNEFDKDVSICNIDVKPEGSDSYIEIKTGKTSLPIKPKGRIEDVKLVVCYKVTWNPPKLGVQIPIPISLPVSKPATPTPPSTPVSTPAPSTPTTPVVTEQPKPQPTRTVEEPPVEDTKKAEAENYELIKRMADTYRINNEYEKAIAEYKRLLNQEQYRDYASTKINYCESKIKEAKDAQAENKALQKTKASKSEPPKVQDNTLLINNFKEQVSALQENCKPLLEPRYKLLVKDSILLTKKLRLCKNLSSEIEKSKVDIKIQEDENTLQNFIEQLATLRKEIVEKLTPLPIDIKVKLMEDFREAVSYVQDSAALAYVKNFIDDNKYKSDWYNWWGKWTVLDSLDNIEKTVAQNAIECRIFIDSVLAIPKYSGSSEFINDFEYIFTNDIQNKIEEYRAILKGDSFKYPILKLTILGIIVLIIIFFAFILLYMVIHNKRKEIEKKKAEIEKEAKHGKSTFKKIEDTTPEQAGTVSISSVSSDKPKFKQLLKKYEYGLADVKANVGRIYKEINMFDLVKDSSIHKVYISRDFIMELYKFFNEFLKLDSRVPETGCYIIGRWDYAPGTNQQSYDISLEYMIKPGRDAKYSEFECDFGAEIGTSLIMANRKYSEQSNVEYVHTSWMHSHPGLQLFLSKQDLIVQNTLTNNSPYKRMLAIVIDTKTEYLEMAFFSPKTSDEKLMNNDIDIKKTLTLDELLKWAKTPYIEPKQTEQTEQPKPDMKVVGTPTKEYFDISDKLKITRAVSVDMITANEGAFIGKCENNQIFIDELSDNQTKTPDTIGFFKEISAFENSEEWEKQKQNLLSDEFWKSNKVLVIYCLHDENLYFFAEKPTDNNLEIQNLKNIATITPFQELKNWTRKNRS